ncbi:MAG: hypothetical protein PF961_22810, partial [Planctomycetota bacterium]|nr:hypothetical protein [Planctomycetota bacterium]
SPHPNLPPKETIMLIKTTTLVVGGTMLGGALLLGLGPLSSYLRTSARVATENVHNAVPTGFEIERIQTLVGDLDDVIIDQQSKLVKQRVDLDYLRQDVERSQQRLEHLESEVGEARKVLSVERASYRIGDQNYQRGTVIREAKNKAESLVRAREIAEAKQETLSALTGALQQAEAQLGKARSQRETYAMRLAELRAKAENVAIRQELVTSLGELPDAIDAGAFQEVEQAFQRVERDIEVQDRLLDDAYSAVPKADEISFTAADEGDVLAILDGALGRTDAPALADGSTPAHGDADTISIDPIVFSERAQVH